MADTLSDGERQKVMIAKALAQDTPVILLDEPTAFLDYPSKVEIMLLLHDLSRETGKTIFLSTHDLDLALQLADKVWLLDKELKIWLWTARCPVTFPVPALLSIPPADCSGWILPARVESVSWAQGHRLR